MKKIILIILLVCSFSSWATNYYFSNSGNDVTGVGSIGNPYASTTKVNAITYVAGDSILFKRGDTFRGYINVNQSGNASNRITYAAYGTGAKPLILGSIDLSSTSNWVLSSGNIWVTTNAITTWIASGPYSSEMGNLIFNNETGYGFFKQNQVSCTAQGHFYLNQTDKKIYLYSTSNPGTFYSHIEAGGVYAEHIIKISTKNYINILNLDIRYSAAHGISYYLANYCLVDNCSISWIGGAFSNVDGTRYGNAIQLWNACSNIIIRNNIINQVFDAGLTNQGNGTYTQSDIWYYGNFISNCWYSYEVFEYSGSTLTNVNFDNNTCVSAGGSWSTLQRPSVANERHIMWWGAEGIVTTCYIRNNIFSGITDNNQAVRFDAACHAILSNNLYYVTNVGRLGYPTPVTYSTLLQWQTASSNDVNSKSGNPLFTSASDYSLQSASPARNSGIEVGIAFSETHPDIGAFEYNAPLPAVLATISIDNQFNTTSRDIAIYATVSSDGGGTISERGICWNTSDNPSTSNNKKANGSGVGAFYNFIDDLSPATTYYLKAYAINEAGTSYSTQVVARTSYSSDVKEGGKTIYENGKVVKN